MNVYYYTEMYYVLVDNCNEQFRPILDDIVTFYGKSDGLYDGSNEGPKLFAFYYEVKNCFNQSNNKIDTESGCDTSHIRILHVLNLASKQISPPDQSDSEKSSDCTHPSEEAVQPRWNSSVSNSVS